MMLRLAAGARLQPTQVGRPSESIVVAGEAYFGYERADRGDYAMFGCEDGVPEVSSDSGATVFVRFSRSHQAAPTPTNC